MPQVSIPEICASSASFGIIRADNATELLSGAEVYTVFAKAVWSLSFQLPLTPEGSDKRKWQASLIKLSSFGNYFLAGPPGYLGAAYSGSTPVVDGAGQIGLQLNIKGADASSTVLQQGEYFQVGNELKMVTEDCVSNASGLATVEFEPALRDSPTDEAVLELQSPKAKFRLIEPRSDWGIQPGRFYLMQIDAIESFAP